jgi:hypothetical protein
MNCVVVRGMIVDMILCGEQIVGSCECDIVW